MFDRKSDTAWRLAPLAVSMCALACTVPALAQDGGGRADGKRPAVSRAKPISPNSTSSLVNLLVKQGVITEEQATALIKQADDEAYVARESAKSATARAEEAAKTANAASAAASPPGTKHVTYVPEIVKRQLREEIKRDVMDACTQRELGVAGQVSGMGTAHPFQRRHARALRRSVLSDRK